MRILSAAVVVGFLLFPLSPAVGEDFPGNDPSAVVSSSPSATVPTEGAASPPMTLPAEPLPIEAAITAFPTEGAQGEEEQSVDLHIERVPIEALQLEEVQFETLPTEERPAQTPPADPAPVQAPQRQTPPAQTPPTQAPAPVAANAPTQTPLAERRSPEMKYPKIVLYSVSWCPHCKAAKEYLTRNNIPFINRDVEIDPEAYDILTRKYKSESVPVIVIGDDAEVIRGFNEDQFQKVLDKYIKK